MAGLEKVMPEEWDEYPGEYYVICPHCEHELATIMTEKTGGIECPKCKHTFLQLGWEDSNG